MGTQLRALEQWEVIDGTLTVPVPASPLPTETGAINAWKLRKARAYAEIALRLEDDHRV